MGKFRTLAVLILGFLFLIGKPTFSATADDFDRLIDQLYKEHSYANRCPTPIITEADGCRAICPEGFVLKSGIDSNGYYTCQNEKERDIVCTYRNYLCTYNEYKLIDKVISDFKKEIAEKVRKWRG